MRGEGDVGKEKFERLEGAKGVVGKPGKENVSELRPTVASLSPAQCDSGQRGGGESYVTAEECVGRVIVKRGLW